MTSIFFQRDPYGLRDIVDGYDLYCTFGVRYRNTEGKPGYTTQQGGSAKSVRPDYEPRSKYDPIEIEACQPRFRFALGLSEPGIDCPNPRRRDVDDPADA
jgi:hypothetical protein